MQCLLIEAIPQNGTLLPMQSRVPPLLVLPFAPRATNVHPLAAPRVRDHRFTFVEAAAGKEMRQAISASIWGWSGSERFTASSTGESLKE